MVLPVEVQSASRTEVATTEMAALYLVEEVVATLNGVRPPRNC